MAKLWNLSVTSRSPTRHVLDTHALIRGGRPHLPRSQRSLDLVEDSNPISVSFQSATQTLKQTRIWPRSPPHLKWSRRTVHPSGSPPHTTWSRRTVHPQGSPPHLKWPRKTLSQSFPPFSTARSAQCPEKSSRSSWLTTQNRSASTCPTPCRSHFAKSWRSYSMHSSKLGSLLHRRSRQTGARLLS